MIQIDIVHLQFFPPSQYNGRLNPKVVSVAFALGIHLIGLYAFSQLNHSHQEQQPTHEQVLTIYLVPLAVQPVQPSSPGVTSIKVHPAVKHAIPKPHMAVKSDTPIQANPAPLQTIAQEAPPVDAQADNKVASLDPAELVKQIRFDPDEGKSELVKMIESHGGIVHLVPKTKYERFHDAVNAATVPSCLGADGLKFEPHFGGLLGIPFVVHAAMTGKCR